MPPVNPSKPRVFIDADVLFAGSVAPREHGASLVILRLADPKDLPILAAALREGCPWLVSFNLRHFRPGHPAVQVLAPGEFVLRVRERLTGLGEGSVDR